MIRKRPNTCWRIYPRLVWWRGRSVCRRRGRGRSGTTFSPARSAPDKMTLANWLNSPTAGWRKEKMSASLRSLYSWNNISSKSGRKMVWEGNMERWKWKREHIVCHGKQEWRWFFFSTLADGLKTDAVYCDPIAMFVYLFPKIAIEKESEYYCTVETKGENNIIFPIKTNSKFTLPSLIKGGSVNASARGSFGQSIICCPICPDKTQATQVFTKVWWKKPFNHKIKDRYRVVIKKLFHESGEKIHWKMKMT